jgi:hypothetical protein
MTKASHVDRAAWALSVSKIPLCRFDAGGPL